MNNRLGSKDPLALSEQTHPHDAYDTPASLAVAVTRLAAQLAQNKLYTPTTILDPGCGDFGGFGWAAKRTFSSLVSVHGLDIRDVPQRDWYDRQEQMDFLSAKNNGVVRKYDIIMGNPPFELAEEFVWKGLELLKPTGIMLYLFRMAWATTVNRTNDEGIHTLHPFYCQYNLPKRPSWWLYKRPPTRTETDKKKTNTVDYAIFHYTARPGPQRPYLDWLRWDMDDEIEGRFRKEVGLE